MSRPNEGDTRERIVQSARDLLVLGGFEALSMRKVGAAVGISAAAIYRHFEDKDALLSAAVHAGALNFTAYLVRALSQPDARSRLSAMCHEYFAFAHENWSDYQLLFMVDCSRIGLDQMDEQAKASTSHTFQLLVDRVQECQNAGLFRPGDSTAQAVFVWTSIHGLASVWLNGHLGVPEPTYRDLIDTQIELVLAALSP